MLLVPENSRHKEHRSKKVIWEPEAPTATRLATRNSRHKEHSKKVSWEPAAQISQVEIEESSVHTVQLRKQFAPLPMDKVHLVWLDILNNPLTDPTRPTGSADIKDCKPLFLQHGVVVGGDIKCTSPPTHGIARGSVG